MNNSGLSKSRRTKTRKSAGAVPQGQSPEPLRREAAPNHRAGNEESVRANGRSPRGTVVFRFESPTADRVKLVADFTGWEKQPLDLRRVEDGTWQIAVELPRGQYSYRFLVDNEWHDDPRCPDYEPNPYGGLNAVIRVM